MEIDLIRGGRAARDERSGNWPAVRVPLRAGEPDAALDLQPLIDRGYTRGRYWVLPSAEDPKPALEEAGSKRARERLEAADSTGA